MLTKLGKYQILGELGTGAMGIVYRGEDERLGRLVALKTMNADVASDPNLVKRFYREAQAAAKLTHPNIVTIYEIDESNGIPFIAMEFLEGDNLQKLIANRHDLPLLKKLQIIIDSCKGLEHAHQAGIVHRDVKPANIVVLKNGQVKIVDFGIARLGASAMTQTGVVLGTIMYMSPEQVQGQPVDQRSDIFSLGVVLYELLSYHTPFPGEDVPSILFKILNEPPEPITQFIPQCPAQLEQIIHRALAKDREQRYQTNEDFGFDLQRVADGLKRETEEVYLDQGKRSLQAGDFTVAKESLQKVLEIDSSNEVAKALLAEVRDRVQSVQRGQKIEQNLQQVKEALDAKQYDDAVTLIDEALRLDPNHQELKQFRQIAVEQRQRTEKIRRHLERAEKLSAEADLQRAKEELEAVLAIEPKNATAVMMLDSVRKELTQQERLRQVRQCVEGARAHLASKNFSKALELLDKARELDQFNIEVEALTKLVRGSQEKEEKRQLLVQRLGEIEDSLTQGKLDVALASAEKALHEFPDDPQILKLHTQVLRRAELDKKRTFVDEQIQAARDFMTRNQYSSALAVLENALQVAPGDVRLASFVKSVQEAQEQSVLDTTRREAIRKANELIRAEDFAAAIRALEENLARSGQSPELNEILQFARDRQAEQQRHQQMQRVLSRATNLLREQSFDEAVQILTRAQEEFKAEEIAALLADARSRQQAFEKRREEILASALKMLQSGDVAKAAALFEGAPKIYFRDERFQQVYSQCRQGLDRANFVRIAANQIKRALDEEDFTSAQPLLEAALKSYPDDPMLLQFQEQLHQEKLRDRQRKAEKVLQEAEMALGRLEYDRARELLKSLIADSSDLPTVIAQAKSRLHQMDRQEQIQRVLSRAQNSLREQRFDEATQMLSRAQEELKSDQIAALLEEAQARQREFDERREEIITNALQFLQSGDCAKAVALFDGAPKIYFKDENFQRVYSQCRQGLDRANFVRNAADQIKKFLEQDDVTSADSVLDQALKPYPDDPVLLALQQRVQEEELRVRRSEANKVLEEAQMALGSMDYDRARELLNSLSAELTDLPDLAAQTESLLQQVEQRQKEAGLPTLQPGVVPKKRPPARRLTPALPQRDNKSTLIIAAVVVVVVVIAAVFGTWYWMGRNAFGYVDLTATPWAEVTSVSSAKGKNMNVTGETPMRIKLPPGKYSVSLKQGQTARTVEVNVEQGKVSPCNYTFPETKVDDLVQEIVSAY